jgi:hypothetical protein
MFTLLQLLVALLGEAVIILGLVYATPNDAASGFACAVAIMGYIFLLRIMHNAKVDK